MTVKGDRGQLPALDELIERILALDEVDESDLVIELVDGQPRGFRHGRRARDLKARLEGRDWPTRGLSMVGRARLENVGECVLRALDEGVEGDLAEAGVWRGGAAILMRAALFHAGVVDRSVWLLDSFRGMPSPDPDRFPEDAGLHLDHFSELAVTEAEVRANFERFGLLDDRVRFLAGWFEETLPRAPISRLAVLRLDADLYSSTALALEHLYPRLSPGGYLLVDDYAVPACRAAVDEYRERHSIREPLHEIDWSGVWWRRDVAR